MMTINKHTMSRTGISTERALIRVQAISGALFLPFLTIHLCNTLLAIVGVDAYNGFQQRAQQLYQAPMIELLFVLLPLTVHLTAGLSLFFMRRSRNKNRAMGLHSITGLFLAVVILAHVISTRALPYFNGIAAGFEGVAFSLWWMPLFFYPYYFALFMAGSYHASNGALLLLSRLNHRSAYKVSRSAMLALAILSGLALVSFGGLRYDIDNPSNNPFAKLYSSIYGIDLHEMAVQEQNEQ